MPIRRLISAAFSDSISQDTISPFVCLFIKTTIELTHCNTFGIKDMDINFSLSFISKSSHTFSKNFIIFSFSSSCRSNNHKSVSDLNSIIKLLYFSNKWLCGLKIFSFGFFNNLVHKFTVVNNWSFNSGE